MYWKWCTRGYVSVMLITHVAKAYYYSCIHFSYCSLIVQVRNFETYSFACYVSIFLSHFFIYCLQCSAYLASASSEKTWTMRATFPEYVVALATIVGSVLFAVWSFMQTFGFYWKFFSLPKYGIKFWEFCSSNLFFHQGSMVWKELVSLGEI